MSGVRDLRREHFAELPEPRKEEEDRVKHTITDRYMSTIERYIDRLSDHVRKIQEEEVSVTQQFSAALLSLQTKDHKKRQTREDVAREVYQKKIDKIREKRRRYREMLYDAHAERKKLIDSMQIQRDEDDILRRKLAKLSALNAGETSREQRKTAFVDGFAALFFVLQILLLILFGVLARYASKSDAVNAAAGVEGYRSGAVAPFYQFYSDVAMMAVVGFGFLVTYLRKYQYSGVSFTLLVVAFAFQWTIIWSKFFAQAHMAGGDLITTGRGGIGRFDLHQEDLLVGMYGAITVVISFGAVVGVASAFQLLLIAFIEVVLYSLNVYLALKMNVYSDLASNTWSMFGLGGDAAHVHVFGAYFGLAVGWPLGRRVLKAGRGQDDRADSYTSDVFAMIGTLFLFVLWPSFNAGLAPVDTQHRVVANTVLSLCTSVVFAFLGSRVFRGGKFDMIDIQNATLAGGVGIGSAAGMIVQPGSAMIIGACSAVFSTLGYSYLSPVMHKWGMLDTRGVHNLHALPGLIGALSGMVSLAIAYDTGSHIYGTALNDLFPAGAATAGYMLASLVITIALAVIGGLLTGLLLTCFTSADRLLYSDETHFQVSGDFEISADADDAE